MNTSRQWALLRLMAEISMFCVVLWLLLFQMDAKGKRPLSLLNQQLKERSSSSLWTGESFQGVTLSGVVCLPPLLGGGLLAVFQAEDGKGALVITRLEDNGSGEFCYGRKRFRITNPCSDCCTLTLIGENREQEEPP